MTKNKPHPNENAVVAALPDGNASHFVLSLPPNMLMLRLPRNAGSAERI